MNMPDQAKPETARIATIDPARDRAAERALAVLEQMYAYFSFEPLPSEASLRAAA